MPYGIVAVDQQLRIVFFNRAAEQFWATTQADVLGRPVQSLGSGTLHAALQQVCGGSAADAAPIYVPLVRADGGMLTLAVTVAQLHHADGCLRVAFMLDVTRQRAEEEHRRQLAIALDHSDNAILTLCPDLGVAHVNAGFSRVFGYSAKEMTGRRVLDVLRGPHSDPDTVQRIRNHAEAWQKFSADLLLYRKDGRPLWTSITSNPVDPHGQSASMAVAVFTDITHTKMHEVLHTRVLDALVREQPVEEVMELICLELERVAPGLMASVLSLDSEARLRPLAAPSMPVDYTDRVNGLRIGPDVGACGTAAWRGRAVSIPDTRTDPLFASYRGIAEQHGLLACWSSPIKSSGGRVLGTFAFYYRQAGEPDPWHIQLAEICLHLCALALEREQSRARMHQLAFYDSLTGLPNRMMFSARAEQLLVSAESHGRSVAVIFLDVDRFKRVNETQGHAAGDGLLRDITQRLGENLAAGDLVGRQAGDEFVLALPQCTAEQAGGIAERLLGAIAAPSVVGHMTLHPSASIGVAMFPEDGHDIDTLLRHADLAMHRAKTDGGGSFRFFSADMNRLAQERVALETALREAIRRDQLELHYQPQVASAAPHALYGVEVLLRWSHPQLGQVSPARFIPLAEESGLMGELGRWVLRNACDQLADWRARGVAVPRIAVNLSASNFEDPLLLDDLLRHLRGRALQPSDLTLEMTESVMLSAQPGVSDNIDAMQAAGLALSLDDFGTGYSSLSHLHRLPINELKLDMSFVRDLEHSKAARALTNSVLRIGESLHKHVVAEGVENEQQRRLLVELGCGVVQGFLFSRPLSAAALEDWIAARNAAPA
ncbi:MAG TPA: bifunctional diguanylate cyclase/phosphodiesterase [Xanthomonadaceae bacterium]|nr:bifunctional diguanylate cyclase/phosphodiesterase [Xanthomonadaceae bacterium]